MAGPRPPRRRDQANQPGIAVDALGGAVIDPTKNVLDLVSAGMSRQDDLREADSRHLREMVALRAEYDGQLRRAESDRINAIRAVDVAAVQQAAAVSALQAQTLAAQVATSAETLRTQVAAAATQAQAQLAAALEPIQKDIADLRKTQYEQAGGKAQVVENRDDRRDTGTGTRAWIGLAVAAAVGFSSLMLGIAGIVITLLLRK